MQQELTLTPDAINETALLAQRSWSAEAGAAVYFLGVVRGTEAGQSIRALDYESFDRMAAHQFRLIFQQLEARWPIESVRVVHRTGVVPVSEPSLWVEVVAPHRGEAFAACQFLIEEMKRTVPIWKKPVSERGSIQPGGGEEIRHSG